MNSKTSLETHPKGWATWPMTWLATVLMLASCHFEASWVERGSPSSVYFNDKWATQDFGTITALDSTLTCTLHGQSYIGGGYSDTYNLIIQVRLRSNSDLRNFDFDRTNVLVSFMNHPMKLVKNSIVKSDKQDYWIENKYVISIDALMGDPPYNVDPSITIDLNRLCWNGLQYIEFPLVTALESNHPAH